MKQNFKTKQRLFMSIGLLTLAFACSDDNFKGTETTPQETAFIGRGTKKSEKWQMKEKFGFALSSAIVGNKGLHSLV